MNRRMLSRLLAGLLLSAPLWAATQIVDTLRYRFVDPSSSNDLATCTLYITDVTPTANATSTFTPATLPYKVTQGVVSITLQPNDAATPAGTSYSVQYNCAKGKPYAEIWLVPTGGPFKIKDVRAAVLATPTVMVSPAQLTAPGASAGNYLGWTGTSWLPMSFNTGGVIGGDLSGTLSSATVTGIQGHAVTPTVPTDGQLMRWNSTAARWDLVTISDQEPLTGDVDGVNTAYTLTGAPAPAAGLMVFRNGMVQRSGIDYTVSGNTVTFLDVATPQPGDILIAWYRY